MMYLELYFTFSKKPVTIEISNKSDVDEFYKELMTHDIINYTPIIFKREDFKYAIVR